MVKRRVLAVAGCGTIVLLSAGCGAVSSPAPPAKITVTPANGATRVRPELPVVVTAAQGRLTGVTVRPSRGHEAVTGAFDAARHRWASSPPLKPATEYTVTATAKNADGKITEVTGTFRTLTPERTFGIADITPMPGETVGVGMPLIVKFSDPVYDKANVERAMKVTSTAPEQGAWHWFGDEEAVYRTKDYWKPHQTVTLTARLTGVRGAVDTYGTKDYTRAFTIGDAHISTVDVKKHRMTVTVGGKTVKPRRSAPTRAASASTRRPTASTP